MITDIPKTAKLAILQNLQVSDIQIGDSMSLSAHQVQKYIKRIQKLDKIGRVCMAGYPRLTLKPGELNCGVLRG